MLGRRRRRSDRRNSRVMLMSKAKKAGPRPALRGRLPLRPMVGSENAAASSGLRASPGRRERISRGSAVKTGRSLLTSSRLRSVPPSETLKGAPVATRRIVAKRKPPKLRGAESVPERTKRWRRSSRLAARSPRKSPTVSALEVLTTPSSIRRESV